jgi:hypothetical protein
LAAQIITSEGLAVELDLAHLLAGAGSQVRGACTIIACPPLRSYAMRPLVKMPLAL